MNSLSAFVKNMHIFMFVWYEHTLQFCYTADEDSFAVQTLNTIIFFFLKNILCSNFERALKGTGSK